MTLKSSPDALTPYTPRRSAAMIITGIATSAGGTRHPPNETNDGDERQREHEHAVELAEESQLLRDGEMKSTSGVPIASTARPSPAHQCARSANHEVPWSSDFTVAPMRPPASGPATSAKALKRMASARTVRSTLGTAPRAVMLSSERGGERLDDVGGRVAEREAGAHPVGDVDDELGGGGGEEDDGPPRAPGEDRARRR